MVCYVQIIQFIHNFLAVSNLKLSTICQESQSTSHYQQTNTMTYMYLQKLLRLFQSSKHNERTQNKPKKNVSKNQHFREKSTPADVNFNINLTSPDEDDSPLSGQKLHKVSGHRFITSTIYRDKT